MLNVNFIESPMNTNCTVHGSEHLCACLKGSDFSLTEYVMVEIFLYHRLNGASASAAAGAMGNWPPTVLCRVGHGVAQFSSSAYNNF